MMDDVEKGRRVWEVAKREGVDWIDVAAKARELFGPTPEEQAVIDAALIMQPYCLAQGVMSRGLTDAVRALRASREPKPEPRYWTDGYWVFDRNAPGPAIAQCLNRDVAERIARLLNEADQ